MGQADPILTRLGAGPAVKKLVETALALSSSQDPQQRNHAYSFMESAIKELEDGENRGADAGLGPIVDDGINAPKIKEEEDFKTKIHEEEDEDKEKMHEENNENDDHKLHEEELSNHNQGARTTGSEQSTENVAPYAGEGVDTTTGEKPMQDMDDTVNQWSETNGMIVPGLPPSPEMMNGGMPGGGMPPPMPPGAGLAPDIAQEMGAIMPPMPQLNDNQMMRQMQYTIRQEMKNYDNKVVAPLMRHIKAQNETIKEHKKAIKALATEIRETKTASGTMKLDLDTMRQNANATFREIEPKIQGFTSPAEIQSVTGVQPLPNYQRNKVAIARSEIEQMDKMLNSNKNPMYN